MTPTETTFSTKSNQDVDQQKKTLLNQKLWKTSMCSFFLSGRCKFGSDCNFAHCEAELQVGPDLCKTRLCEAFAAGHCTKANCPFAHGSQDVRPTGFAFKTSLCMWHAKGKCVNGSRCRFAHGKAELRRSGDAVPFHGVASQPSPQPQFLEAGGKLQEPQRLQSTAAPFIPRPMKVSPAASKGSAIDGAEHKSLAQGLADISTQLRHLELRMEMMTMGAARKGSSISPSCSTVAGSSDDETEGAYPSAVPFAAPPGLELPAIEQPEGSAA